jgi:MurNAc alpha-1-phosphate uridylyltransferase
VLIDTAMVMAAGLGKRMRPLTATRPKPLVEVMGKPLVDHVIDHLRAAGITKIVVNVHYLADSLEAHLVKRAEGLDLIISDERAKLLETGGGLIHAKALIGDAPFFCLNADNFWIDGPVSALDLMRQRWDETRMDALLLMVPHARAHCHNGRGDFHLDGNGLVSRRKASRVAPFVWTGIQILHPRLLIDPPADKFSTNVFWDRAIEAGRCYGMVHQGLWFDVGTPPAIKLTEAIIADV